MPDTKSKGDFLIFRETLTELEYLVDVRRKGKLFTMWSDSPDRATTAIEDGIVHVLELLAEYDINTSEANAIEELERLAEMRIARLPDTNYYFINSIKRKPILDKIIDCKIDFIQRDPFSRTDSEDFLGAKNTLERLAVVKTKTQSQCMIGLLEAKIREIVWRPRAKASSRHVHVVRGRCY